MDDKVISPTLEKGDSRLNPTLSASVNKKLIDANIEQKRIEKEEKKEERGFLGHLWGSIEHSSNNIAGLFIILILIIGTLYTIWLLLLKDDNAHTKILEFWEMLSPMLTLALGYLFGNGQKRVH